jgi:hypothetical protein
MEERILLYRNKEEINKQEGHIYYMIRDHIQPFANELKELGMDGSKDELFAIIEDIGRPLTKRFKEKAKEDTKLMPAVYFVVEEKYMKLIDPVLKRAVDLKVIMNNSSLGFKFYKENIIVSADWEVEADPSFRERLEERYSEYVDSDGRKKIWEEAHKLIDHINEFKNLINEHKDKGIEKEFKKYAKAGLYMAPLAEILAIRYPDMYHNAILTLKSDGELEINKEDIAHYIP